jgi:hypothetical protein
MKKFSRIIIIFMIVSGFAVPSFAQESGGQVPGTARGQRPAGQRGMMGDPAQMQQMLGERFKDVLGLSDDEWKVIGPKVTKVFEMSFQQRGNPMRLFGNRGPQGPQGPQGQLGPQGQQGQRQFTQRGNNPAFQAGAADESIQQLQKLLENKDAPAADIKNAVNKVRKDREKMEQEKLAAQKELRELLTVRQEATLISMGLLD